MNFFRVLINPEQEETGHPDRKLVGSAANLLQVGEFQLLQLAYHAWFGKDLPPELVSPLFTTYMIRCQVPPGRGITLDRSLSSIVVDRSISTIQLTIATIMLIFENRRPD